MTNTRLCTSISSLAVAAAMASQPLLAEDRADAEGFTLEEITVTAQKRAKSLLDVPISINAITGDIIRKSNITDIRGLMSLAPTLNVTQSAAPGDVIVAIRGLGTSSFNIGIEPSVGIFVDGVYRARTGTAIGDFLSLERAEILRGPQSTLFGKNTSAGVISFVTKKPEYDAGGMVSATYGNYDQVIVKGTVTGPIVDDKVAFRLSGNVNSRSGFITNLFDGSEVNDKDRWALRGQLLFEPSETVSVRMIADYSQIDERCCAAPFVFNGPTQGAIAALGGTVIGPINAPSTPFDRRVSFDGILNTTMDDFGFSAEVTVDLDGFEITSITAYRDFQTAVDIDTDYTDIDITVRNGSESAIQIFTQEVRFTSTEDTVVDWMAGGFYSNQSLDSLGWSLYGADTRPYFDLLAGFGTIVKGSVIWMLLSSLF
ncbi:MAG: TonB-dependent receptor plug domain-containing protein [Kordiimonadaceae bacterium]|nr:TonB-dependent receptor plug domain-containing protein [Kordiimonadaceae bacterium]